MEAARLGLHDYQLGGLRPGLGKRSQYRHIDIIRRLLYVTEGKSLKGNLLLKLVSNNKKIKGYMIIL